LPVSRRTTHKRTKVERAVPESEAISAFPVFGAAGASAGTMTGNTCFPYTPDRDRIGPTNTGLAKTETTVGLAEYAETPTDRFSDRPSLGLCVPGGQFVTSGPIARLKITLDDVNPIVQRRVEVPLTMRLDRLHLVLQAALGWTNSHLYEIRAGDVGWGMKAVDALARKWSRKPKAVRR